MTNDLKRFLRERRKLGRLAGMVLLVLLWKWLISKQAVKVWIPRQV